MDYGFVYIWRDRHADRFYIGSHWGPEDDGYVCSSNGKTGMRAEYKRRTVDFRRRILCRVYTNHRDLLDEEQRWLNMIPPHEFGVRYYNISASVRGMLLLDEAAQRESRRKATLANRGRKLGPKSEETRRKISEAKKGKKTGPRSQEVRDKIAKGHIGIRHSLETKAKLSAITKQQFSSIESRALQSHRLMGRKLSEQHRKNVSAGLKKSLGKLGWAKGYIWINDGTKAIQIPARADIPKGFVLGRVIRPPTEGKNWINDGIADKLIGKNEPLPSGFIYGRCNAVRQKISESRQMQLHGIY